MFKSVIYVCAVAALTFYWMNYIKKGPIYKSDKRLDGKTVLITGGNVGIGKAAAIEFAKRGAKVIIASRNLKKSEEAKDEIIKKSTNKNIRAMKLDLSDFSSIKSFAEEFDEQEENLHYLVNNAGVLMLRGMVDYGYNRVMAINHFGPFLLTHLLMDKMKQQSLTSPVRIINLSSKAYKIGPFDFDMMHQDSEGIVADFRIYGQSKLANIYFTNELNKRLKGFDITTYSVHPGAIKSDLGDNGLSTPFTKAFQLLVYTFFLRDPIYGAQTIMYCALDDNVTQYSGDYFAEAAHAELADFATIKEVGARLWKESVEVTKAYLPKEL